MLGKPPPPSYGPCPLPFKFQFYLRARPLSSLAGLELTGLRVSPTEPSNSTGVLLSEVAHISWGTGVLHFGRGSLLCPFYEIRDLRELSSYCPSGSLLVRTVPIANVRNTVRVGLHEVGT